jgi:hypothetical protein
MFYNNDNNREKNWGSAIQIFGFLAHANYLIFPLFFWCCYFSFNEEPNAKLKKKKTIYDYKLILTFETILLCIFPCPYMKTSIKITY